MELSNREALIVGLVGEEVHLYRTSAAFRTAIDTLAQMLPVWVAGFARDAAKVDSRMDALIKAQLQGPPSNGKLSPTGEAPPGSEN